MAGSYLTIKSEGQGRFTEKMSRFLAFALPVSSPEQAKEIVKRFQNEYHDARHVCWAYMLGPARDCWQLNDNGEPSGTAGKPILGQINSAGLTDIIIVVVRYFGGIKLGTPGLTAAYREAARLAIEAAQKEERFEMELIRVRFPYMAADGVMKLAKRDGVETVESSWDNTCSLTLRVRKDMGAELRSRLKSLSGVSLV